MNDKDQDLLLRLDKLNEDAKALGNDIYERGPEWHELANHVYHGAKNIWIAFGILQNYLNKNDSPTL